MLFLRRLAALWPSLAVAAISALSFFRLLSKAERDGYWFDELWSIDAVAGSFGRMLELVSNDVHPPGYHVLLWFWGQLFGLGELSTRTLSVLGIVASIPLVYLLARRLRVGEVPALGVAAITGLAFASMQYGLEARPYAWTLFWVTATMVVFSAESWSRLRAVAAVSLGIGAGYFHYGTMFTLLPLGMLVAVWRNEPRRLFVLAGWLIGMAPYGWHIAAQASRFEGFGWLKTPGWFELKSFLAFILGAPGGHLWLPAAILLGTAAALFRKRAADAIWMWAAPFALAGAWVVSYAIQPVFHGRYYLALLPWFWLPAAYALDLLPRWMKVFPIAVMVVPVWYNMETHNRLQTEGWREAARYATEHEVSAQTVTTENSRFFRVYVPDITVFPEAETAAAAVWIDEHAGEHYWMLQARDYKGTPATNYIAERSALLDIKQFRNARAMLLKVQPRRKANTVAY